MSQPLSLVSTVLNDHGGCVAFLEQMLAQTRRPDEIVIVDGGSTDGTWELLQGATKTSIIPFRAIQEKGCNVARGRDIAIESASHELIVSTDIGCQWAPEWIEELVSPFFRMPELEAVMGSWAIDPRSIKEWGLIESAILPSTSFVAMPQSHASSRSIAYRKRLWERIGGYPEDLTFSGDDLVFALLLHKVTDNTAAAPIPRVSWERPTSLKSYCKEARRYNFGAGEAGIWLKHALLVGGRLLLEFIGIAAGVIAVVSGLYIVGGLLIGLAFVSILARILRLRQAVARARNMGVYKPWTDVLQFVYRTKCAGLVGYWTGVMHGHRRCRNCRERLRFVGIGWF